MIGTFLILLILCIWTCPKGVGNWIAYVHAAYLKKMKEENKNV